MKKRLLRIVNTGKYGPGIDASKGVFGVEKSSMGDIDSKVIIHSSDYQKIFGALKKDLPTFHKRLCVVKIKSAHGCSIHRECIAHPLNTERCAAVTWHSLSLLDLEGETMPIVEMTKGSRWAFYWHHPVHATRISTRLGAAGIIISVLMSILSIVISLCI